MVITVFSIVILVPSSFAAVVTPPSSYNTPPPAYNDPLSSYHEPAPSYQKPAYGVYPDYPTPVVHKDLKTFVENHLAPHYDGLVCYGLNASYHLLIKTRMALGCSLAKDTKLAPANKYSACEVSIMKKLLMCNENDYACYTAHLNSLASCKESCCKGNPEYCHAAVCRGLARSFVDVDHALAYCKDILFPLESPETCPFLSSRWLSCRPLILSALEVCSQEDSAGKLACMKSAQLLGHAKCIACIDQKQLIDKNYPREKRGIFDSLEKAAKTVGGAIGKAAEATADGIQTAGQAIGNAAGDVVKGLKKL